MPDIGYVYLACGFVLAAIGVNPAVKFNGRAWISRGLQCGNLYSLVDVASGLRPNGLTRDQARRYGGNYRASMKGRLALLVHSYVHRRLGIAG